MSSNGILSYLKRLCSDIDNGRPLRRFPLGQVLAPFVIPAAIGLGAGCCAAETPPPQTAPDEVVVIDAEPVEDVEATAPLYAAPPPVVVTPGPPPVVVTPGPPPVVVTPAPPPVVVTPTPPPTPALYAVPMPPPARVEECGNGVDDDRDGAIDCADSDCASLRVCMGPVALYAAPSPIVGGDDDHRPEPPRPQPRYMAPFRGR